MTEQNINRFYETLMLILSKKHDVNISFEIKKAA